MTTVERLYFADGRRLSAGDAVAMIVSNRPEFAEVLYGCQRSGLRAEPPIAKITMPKHWSTKTT